MEELLSVQETATFLRVSGTHLRKLIKDGEIPFINISHGKIRKRKKIKKQALSEFVERGGVR